MDELDIAFVLTTSASSISLARSHSLVWLSDSSSNSVVVSQRESATICGGVGVVRQCSRKSSSIKMLKVVGSFGRDRMVHRQAKRDGGL